MSNQAYPDPFISRSVDTGLDVGLRGHMSRIYQTMTTGMLITAVSAWLINTLSWTQGGGQAQLTEFGNLLFGTPLKWVIAFLPLVMILMAGTALRRLSGSGLRTAFYAIAAMIGVSFSTLLAAFTGVSIASTFLATAAGFAGLSLYGYTTRRNLSGFGAFLIVGLIGLIIVMIANIFIQSTAVAMAISVIGVLVFAGLTAADTQRAKTEYLSLRETGAGDEMMSKVATMSALSLYLDFLNLFQFLLSFMGVRKD